MIHNHEVDGSSPSLATGVENCKGLGVAWIAERERMRFACVPSLHIGILANFLILILVLQHSIWAGFTARQDTTLQRDSF